MIRTLVLMVLAGVTSTVAADTLTVIADRDNTLFGPVEEDLSSGSSSAIYAGRIADQGGVNNIRRAALHFDVSGLPAGATVSSAKVMITVTKTPPAAPTNLEFSLHRCEAEWGESTSNSAGGAGAFAEIGDATWFFRFYPETPWSTPGGDFVATASGSTVINGNGGYEFVGSGLANDVQSWIDGEQNDGWLMTASVSEEKTVRKIASREYFDATKRPALIIEYEVAGIPGDFNGDGLVNGADLGLLLGAWGRCTGCVEDMNGDGFVTGADLGLLLGAWSF